MASLGFSVFTCVALVPVRYVAQSRLHPWALRAGRAPALDGMPEEEPGDRLAANTAVNRVAVRAEVWAESLAAIRVVLSLGAPEFSGLLGLLDRSHGHRLGMRLTAGVQSGSQRIGHQIGRRLVWARPGATVLLSGLRW